MRRVFMINVKPKSFCILQESECAFEKGTVSNYIFFILLLFSLIFLKLTPPLNLVCTPSPYLSFPYACMPIETE